MHGFRCGHHDHNRTDVSAGIHDSVAYGDHGSLGAVGDTELADDRAHIVAHGAFREEYDVRRMVLDKSDCLVPVQGLRDDFDTRSGRQDR